MMDSLGWNKTDAGLMGAAAAGVVTGAIIDHLGWEYVILCWVVLAVLGIVCILSVKSTNKNKQREAYTV